MRDYQQMAADSFWAGGSGVVVLPCGAGKTIVGAAAMAKAGATIVCLAVGTHFELTVRRSFADYLFRWLCEAGAA